MLVLPALLGYLLITLIIFVANNFVILKINIMKNLVLPLLILLASCGVIKRTHKTEVQTAKTDSVATTIYAQVDTTKQQTHNGGITTHSETVVSSIDTSIKAPGTTTTGSAPMLSAKVHIADTGSATTSDGTKVKWHVNTTNNKVIFEVKTPDRQIPVTVQVTVSKHDTTRSDSFDTSTITKASNDTSSTHAIIQSKKTDDFTEVKYGRKWWFVIVVAILFVALLIFIMYRLFKK